MNTSINTAMGIKEWAMLIILSILWGGSFFFIELAVTELPPFTIVWVRVMLAALALWIFVITSGLTIPVTGKVWRAFLIMGLLNNVIPFSLIVWGQTHISSGLASILNATTPLFTVIVASLFLADERPTPLKLVGVFIGFIGTVVMIGPSALQGLGAHTLGQLAILGAALSYGFATVFGRRFKAMNVDPVIIAAAQVTISAIVLAPLAILFEKPFSLPFPTAKTMTAVITLAILSTSVAYILYFRLLASAGATNSALVTFLVPVSAIFLGILVLGESLEWIHLVGMGLIAIGLSAIDGRLWRFLAQSK